MEENNITNSSHEKSIGSILLDPACYLIPYFQRQYVWNKNKILELWNEGIERLDLIGDEEQKSSTHFIGVMIKYDIRRQGSEKHQIEVIDGQQRLTSMIIILLAIIDTMIDLRTEKSLNLARTYFNRFVVQYDEHKQIYEPKLIGQESTYPQLRYLIENTYKKYNKKKNELAYENSSNQTDFRTLNPLQVNFAPIQVRSKGQIVSNFHEISRAIKNKKTTSFKDLAYELKSLGQLIDIFLSFTAIIIKIKDPSYGPKIYYDLNAKQTPTTVAELVKNEVFRGVHFVDTHNRQQKLKDMHDNNWLPFKESFNLNDVEHDKTADQKNSKIMESYLLALAVTKKSDIVKDKIFPFYVSEWKNIDLPNEKIDYLSEHKDIYLSLSTGVCDGSKNRMKINNQKISKLIRGLYILKKPSAMDPFLIQIFNAYINSGYDEKSLIQVLQLFESFLVRRNICGIEQTGLNLYFKKLFELCERSPSIEEIVEITKTKYVTIQLPDDEFIAKKIREHNAFNAACLEHILIEYNNHLSKIQNIKSFETREHIYPQTPKSGEWDFSNEEGAKILNTLPNILPVTREHNSSLSNAPFSEKVKSYEKHSMYIMTTDFAKKYKKWDMDKFNERATEITEWFLARFPNYFDK